MTPECNTGFFIPVEKQSLFILVFEERLLNLYRIIPIFGPTRRDKSCEVNFKYTGGNHSMFPFDANMAKIFLKENQHILGCKNEVNKRSNTSSRVTEVINLDDEISPSANETRTVDLTQGEPEVIVLDETLNRLNKTLSQLDATFSSIDEVEIIDTSTLNSSKGNIRKFGNDIEIVCVKANKKIGMKTLPTCTVTSSTSQIKENKHKRKNVDNSNALSVSLNSSGKRVVKCSSTEKPKKSFKRSLSHSNVSESPKNKKRKLQDVSNIPSSVTSPAAKLLSDNVMKYYTQVSNDIQKCKNRKERRLQNKVENMKKSVKKGRQIRKQTRLRKQNISKKTIAETSRLTPPAVHNLSMLVGNRYKNKEALQTQIIKHQRQKIFSPRKQKLARINTTFNPNPHDVDREGLRPVVIDGCNIAVGHGKGTFSVKGIKICVEYFANRGHEQVKVFLPANRKIHFSEEVLAELNTKSQIVFTPSQYVSGVWKTSYDDRFIVEYAFEFGGVIVSTDNYRDLLKENPKWRDTIEKRLLMFTWVDDFLMFPLDPLGRTGPTLEQFLRF